MTERCPAARSSRGRIRPTATEGRRGRLFFYATTRGLSEVLLALRGLFLASLLTPAGFGAWTLFRIAGRYTALAELGVRRGLEFEVSTGGRAEAAVGESESVRFGRTALGYIVVVFGAIAALSLVGSFMVQDPTARFAMRVFSVAVVLERIWHYALAYLRSSGDLRSFARLEVVYAALHLAFSGVLALLWGLRGALLGFVAAGMVSALLMVRRVPFAPGLSLGALRRLLDVGFPVAVALAASSVLVTVDRLVVAAFGGTELLGQYAFAAAIATAAATLAWVVRTVVFTDVYRGSKDRGAGSAVRDLLDRTVLPFAFLYPPVLGVAALGIAPVVDLLFPAYADAVAPARLFIFVGAAAGFSGLGSLGAVAASRQRQLPLFAALALLLNLALSVLALLGGAGIEGVAASTLLSRTAYGAAIIGLSATTVGIREPGRFVARAVFPLAYCALVVYGLGEAFPAPEWRHALASWTIYCAFLIPLVPFLRRRIRRARQDGSR